MNKKINILFVCTGNTCRSSMAQVLFEEMVKDHGIEGIEVLSAGTSVFYPSGASEKAIQVMRDKGIDLTQHRAQQVTCEMIGQADLILTMTNNHRQALVTMCPEAADKIFTLKEYAYGMRPNDVVDISDPFGLSIEHYSICSDQIVQALEKVVEKIKNENA
ncbi:low molecular weight protein arginine phosphatase [Petroclostridium sp. X23]|uniref:low molecular weight protein arginine phosphatase n=1 Tax=Petroclostridium sp. X23 TaxID=3045146 RepID=UPI0024AE4551|nr:low molecular weight protein arginine phosphatase [Petroclostridium sp. X23]WHH57537.1 low molecular weight protein arginine phosphatase [Petroclostridium sp. X23]